MLRVKDPEKSVKYYEFLGMKQINKLSFPDNEFDLYFLAYDDVGSASEKAHWTDRQGVLELTHNYGSEKDDAFKIANGNSDPGKGFCHVCISVDNIQAACQRIEDAGFRFQKKVSDGQTKNMAIALDPDGYWVNIIPQTPVEKTEDIKDTNLESYRFNHTMIRVKDKIASLNFYQQIMGMNLLYTLEIPEAGFDLCYLGYPSATKSDPSSCEIPFHEGLIGLTWNYGTEKDPELSYHSGNTDPKGFGHFCISVDDLEAACARFEEKGVQWKKRRTEGRMKHLAFFLDPDGYWIEVIQNANLEKTND